MAVVPRAEDLRQAHVRDGPDGAGCADLREHDAGQQGRLGDLVPAWPLVRQGRRRVEARRRRVVQDCPASESWLAARSHSPCADCGRSWRVCRRRRGQRGPWSRCRRPLPPLGPCRTRTRTRRWPTKVSFRYPCALWACLWPPAPLRTCVAYVAALPRACTAWAAPCRPSPRGLHAPATAAQCRRSLSCSRTAAGCIAGIRRP
mmetsp:Transcript_19859/g.76092  ORF Transcript_19859/g.76092 Transcript_19859/m.76092 type:complete len:203 (+) Transcript_19859:703-1311(+)